jgi:ribosomal protein L24E
MFGDTLPKVLYNNYNKNNNYMYKTCAVCGLKVYPGTGTYYGGRLVHTTCLGVAKIQRYRLYAKRKVPAKGRKKKAYG